MTVKVKRKKLIMGKEVEVTIYLPEEVILTRDRREKADNLDIVLKAEVEKINKEFEKLDKQIKETEIKKWRWLGGKIDNILKSVSLIEENDKTNNNMWPAIGQYLRKELKRGLDDKKRSGTKNDHYKKCWELYTVPGNEWITSWVGWDAFTDRGEQLVSNRILIKLLGQKFKNYPKEITSDDYQEIAKFAVKYIPTQSRNPADIESMPGEKLEEIANKIFDDFIERKKAEY